MSAIDQRSRKSAVLWLQRVLATLSLAVSGPVFAFIGEVSFVPAKPSASDDVHLVVPFGECDAILSAAPERVVQSGNEIEVTVRGLLYPSSYCVHPLSSAVLLLGSFDAGVYNVRLVVRDPENLSEPEVYRHGTFTVSARSEPPRVIPASRPATLWILAAMVVGSAAVAIAVRRSTPG